MRIAKEGYPIIFAPAVLSGIAFTMDWVAIGCILLLITLSVAAFFRDPERTPPRGEGLIVSPADGKVVSIAEVKEQSSLPEAMTRISIFLSPLDVHINRTPVGGLFFNVKDTRGIYSLSLHDELPV